MSVDLSVDCGRRCGEGGTAGGLPRAPGAPHASGPRASAQSRSTSVHPTAGGTLSLFCTRLGACYCIEEVHAAVNKYTRLRDSRRVAPSVAAGWTHVRCEIQYCKTTTFSFIYPRY